MPQTRLADSKAYNYLVENFSTVYPIKQIALQVLEIIITLPTKQLSRCVVRNKHSELCLWLSWLSTVAQQKIG